MSKITKVVFIVFTSVKKKTVLESNRTNLERH